MSTAVTTPEPAPSSDPSGAPKAAPAVDLTVLIPVYNEEGNIAGLVEEVVAALEGLMAYEILLVNDGSADNSAEEMAATAARLPVVRCLHHLKRSGKSAALWTGLRHARGTWIQMLDGDGQNDPADVRKLWLEVFAEGAPPRLGLVAGQRLRRNDGIVKFLSSRIANATRRTLLRDGTPDTGCGFKMIRKEAFEFVPFFGGMHRFFPALVGRAGWEVQQFPVNDRARTAGVSKYGFFDRLGAGIVDLAGVVWLMNRGAYAQVDPTKEQSHGAHALAPQSSPPPQIDRMA